jgi:hypothetical protein
MKHTIVRYKTKPEATAENRRLIESVFEALHAAAPDGIRYAVLSLADGSFIHIVESTDGSAPLTGLPAFRSFTAGIQDRCLVPPQSSEATLVGSYRVFGDGNH